MDVQDLIDRLRNVLDSAEFDMHEEDVADAEDCETVPLACDGGPTSGDAEDVCEAEMERPYTEGMYSNNSGNLQSCTVEVPSGRTIHYWIE